MAVQDGDLELAVVELAGNLDGLILVGELPLEAGGLFHQDAEGLIGDLDERVVEIVEECPDQTDFNRHGLGGSDRRRHGEAKAITAPARPSRVLRSMEGISFTRVRKAGEENAGRTIDLQSIPRTRVDFMQAQG